MPAIVVAEYNLAFDTAAKLERQLRFNHNFHNDQATLYRSWLAGASARITPRIRSVSFTYPIPPHKTPMGDIRQNFCISCLQ